MADLRFGTFLAPNMLPVYQAIADFVGAQLGLSTELVVETDYRNCVNDVNDVSFVCGLPYVTYERQGLSPAVPIAAPILTGKRYGGRPVYFSDVIVRRDSPARSFLDLRGRSWAYNEPLSQSGYGITRHHLVSIGETDGYFGEVVEAGFHEAAIDMVRRGEVDASAIDSHVLEVAMRTDPSLRDEIAVVDVLGPSTIQPITVTKRLPADSRRSIQRVLTELHHDRTMRAHLDFGLIDRITAVDESDYDDIRRMLDECEASGFMEIR
jgi:phosphonate transport system substrate-binding protein